MKNLFRYIFPVVTAFLFSPGFGSKTNAHIFYNPAFTGDTIPVADSLAGPLPFPFEDKNTLPFQKQAPASPLQMQDPKNFSEEVEYNPETGEYEFRSKVGGLSRTTPYSISFEDYKKYDYEKAEKDYWRQRFKTESFQHESSLIPSLHVGSELFETIFGSNTIDIKPQGSAKLTFGINYQNQENGTLAEELRKTTTFDFKEEIQMDVKGKIGENLELGVHYDTEASFEFENKMNLRYQGKEDDIIQKIEAGDVSLPLPGTLITGSQALFGVLTELKFGKLSVTTLLSQQESEAKTIEVQGAAQKNNFEIEIDDYDANRHFFMAKYFHDVYDTAMSYLPVINSGINITKVEVWVTNKSGEINNTRNVVAMVDLGESRNINTGSRNIFNDRWLINYNSVFNPFDSINNVYQTVNTLDTISNVTPFMGSLGLTSGRDYEKLENARKLNPNDYKINAKLGYISLNSALNSDEVLGVAFEYTYRGKTYRVGEFSNSGVTGVLIVKLLKGTSMSPKQPYWDLMMKNIYSLNAYQISPDNFMLDIKYNDAKTGTLISSLREGLIRDKRLLRVMKFDNLNAQQIAVPGGDGVFDFLDGYTILPSNGKVIFPMVEPFGKYLFDQMAGPNPQDTAAQLANTYAFTELYDSSLTIARNTGKNKFVLTGQYLSSSGSDISLNATNVPRGSVKVTAGGRLLTENVEYTVNYTMGSVKIIDQGLLESNTPIQISFESNTLFAMQSKRMLGTHLEYKFNNDISVGATILNLTEKPLTPKVNIGEEPISNTVYGLNASFRQEVPFLTKMVDKLPLIETKEASNISFTGEFAYLKPGHSKAIKKAGEAYIDDFENSETSITLVDQSGWVLASTPQGQSMFPEAVQFNDINYGKNRAKLSWFYIDPIFYGSNSPVSRSEVTSIYTRRWYETDLFPNKQVGNQLENYLSVFNLAYYPKERGPYNFDTQVASDGSLLNPENRWAGIIHKMGTTDFEAGNYEYIEFWMLDPYAEDADSGIVRNDDDPGFYINLGDVSEDILRDSRKSFENGLPVDDNEDLYIETNWGRVPVSTQINQSFENDKIQAQDVGLDGLKSIGANTELEFLERKHQFPSSLQSSILPEAYQRLSEDPASDNFKYYNSGAVSGLGVFERYKNYNNTEGNSSTSGEINYQTTDIEDLNDDKTVNETERYFQYKISLRPDNMEVGKNYITNIQTVTVKINGVSKAVKWYQFKIPLSKPDDVIGDIEDFRSIRFMRMFLRGLKDRTFFRFAYFNMVRGEWRRYNFTMKEEDETLNEDEDLSAAGFDITAVNIEENALRTPVNYVLPPDVDRVVDPSNPQLKLLNEQSMAMRVDSLHDGYSKAAYRNISMDMRQYKRIKMFVHAEQRGDEILRDSAAHIFIRLGTDFQDNYYEYEIPLKLTPFGDNQPDQVWPAENRFDVPFDVFYNIKQERNNLMRKSGSNVSLLSLYTQNRGKNIVRVKGNPNLSDVRVVMVGIRNPKQKYNTSGYDDGEPISVEVWVNELRLSDFIEDGGWAANARLSFKLADFATVNITGSTLQPGYGSIEKKMNERSKVEINQYDISSNLELGKFFPESAKIKIPMYVGYSDSRTNPKYNPLDPDIPIEATLNNPELTERQRDSVRKVVQDRTVRKSLNFTNLGIQPSGETKFYSPSNWSANYAFSEISSRNISTEYNNLRTHNGSINYIFNSNPKNVAPFKSVKIFRSQALTLLRDFNFYYAPRQMSFRTSMAKKFNEVLLRNLYDPMASFNPTYNKEWLWSREYDLKYDISRGLKFEFSANNEGRVDEPFGKIDKGQDNYEERRDSILDEIFDLGTTTNYNHKLRLSYTIPINKIPIFAWISMNASYNATYDWELGPQTAFIEMGNTIRNSNGKQLSTQFNLQSLYSKVKYFDRLDKKYKKTAKQRAADKKYENVSFTKDNLELVNKEPKSIVHNLGTEEVEVKATIDSKPVKVKFDIVNQNRITVSADSNLNNVTLLVTGKIEITDNPLVMIFERGLLALMGVKNISIQLNESNGTNMPGYLNETKILGSVNHDHVIAPGWPFILGIQDPDFPDLAIRNQWITLDSALNTPYAMSYNETFTLRSSIEPLPGMKIDVTATRTYGRRLNEYYIPDPTTGDFYQQNGDYTGQNRQISGNFNMSFNSFHTAFDKMDGENKSEAFARFRTIRADIAARLAAENPFTTTNDTAFPAGYGENSQDVLLPAFIAAYSGADQNRVSLKTIPGILAIKPNWRVSYDGLSKIEKVKQYFKSVNLNHAYTSNYSIGGYVGNLNFVDKKDGFTDQVDQAGNFLTRFEVGQVSFNETFSPLLGVDATLKNSMIVKLEFKRSRTVSLSLVSSQITENRGKEFVVGTGYRFDQIPIQLAGKKRVSDLNVRFDLSVRDNATYLRKIIENQEEVTSGMRNFAIKSSADYNLSTNLLVRIFFDYTLDTPKTSQGYKMTKALFGFTLNLTMGA